MIIMKRLSILSILLCATSIAHAQQAGQLYITSYDDTGDVVYICHGQAQNSVTVNFALVNLNPSVPLTVDSIVPSGDTSVFQQQQREYASFVLAKGGASGADAVYAPNRIGDDTIHETAYYNGEFSASASIIFHARSSPNIALYGFTTLTDFSMGGYGFGNVDFTEEIDTMHDKLNSGTTYIVDSSKSMKNGGYKFGDIPVILRSCGGAIIDSIYEVGDFSEFAFDPFPTLPYTIQGDDSLVLNYEFTPKVVDETGSRHHYLVFHSTDGHYLTWSFEYKVYPASSVTPITESPSGIRIFPNPATNEVQIQGGPTGTVRLFDLLGRERAEVATNGSKAMLDVSKLEPGTYFLRIGNQSSSVEIAR